MAGGEEAERLGKGTPQAVVRLTVADRPSCRPLESCAVTANHGPSLFTEITVSKPARRCDPAAARVDGFWPARTAHVSTSVVPFQLTWTAEPRAGLGRTTTAGRSGGCSDQLEVNAW